MAVAGRGLAPVEDHASARGEFRASFQTIGAVAEARRYGREYGLGRWSRAIGMSTGVRRELVDYAGIQAVAEEATGLALSLEFAVRV